eukprot:scaffold2945_cov244-Pinguiococcus_pyrenoidosus.AAC.14
MSSLADRVGDFGGEDWCAKPMLGLNAQGPTAQSRARRLRRHDLAPPRAGAGRRTGRVQIELIEQVAAAEDLVHGASHEFLGLFDAQPLEKQLIELGPHQRMALRSSLDAQHVMHGLVGHAQLLDTEQTGRRRGVRAGQRLRGRLWQVQRRVHAKLRSPGGAHASRSGEKCRSGVFKLSALLEKQLFKRSRRFLRGL